MLWVSSATFRTYLVDYFSVLFGDLVTNCILQVYDLPESHLKLNDVFEFIGIYTFDPELAVYKDTNVDSMYDLMEDDVLSHLPPSKVSPFFFSNWDIPLS